MYTALARAFACMLCWSSPKLAVSPCFLVLTNPKGTVGHIEWRRACSPKETSNAFNAVPTTQTLTSLPGAKQLTDKADYRKQNQ